MPMRKQPLAATPAEYVAGIDGWRLKLVKQLRAAVRTTRGLRETMKWGHLVYQRNGPVLLIRAEAERVLFGFWRGKRLRDIEPRLKAGGKYELATIDLREGDTISTAVVRKLARAAVKLDGALGDPQKDARP